MEIVKDVYQAKAPLTDSPLGYVNVYLVEGEKGNLLIDAGWNTPEAFTAVKDDLNASGFEIKDITQIVITHLHPDHYGLAGKIKQLSGSTIAMSDIDAKMLDSRYVNFEALLKELYVFLRVNGVPDNVLVKFDEASMPARQFVINATPDILLKAGDKVSVEPYEFDVLLTPGHSPGHICLYEPNKRMLFAGDHILPEITPNVGYHPQSGDNPLGDYINSLQSLMELDVSFVFPAHGPVFSGLRRRIEELLYFREKRTAEIVRKTHGEQVTGYKAASQIGWMSDVNPVPFDKLSLRDKRLAVMETLAHLQYLVCEGQAKKLEENGMMYYFIEA